MYLSIYAFMYTHTYLRDTYVYNKKHYIILLTHTYGKSSEKGSSRGRKHTYMLDVCTIYLYIETYKKTLCVPAARNRQLHSLKMCTGLAWLHLYMYEFGAGAAAVGGALP